MLVGHLSDTHLGASPYGLREREDDFYEAFEESMQVMIKDRVDIIIHAGDIFDVPRPSGTALVKLVGLLKQLNEKGIRFYYTLGEHDISRLYETPSAMLYQRAGLATYLEDGKPLTVDGLTLVGFHKRRRTEISELQQKLNAIDAMVQGLSGKKVLVLHQALTEFHQFAGELTSADLPKRFDYYAMGHLHDRFEKKFEDLGGPLCYPGSTDATGNEGIKDSRKGFYIVDFTGSGAKPEWVELTSSRRRLNREIQYEELKEQVARLLIKIAELKKKPLLNLAIKGLDIDSAKVTSAIRALQEKCLYCQWEPVEERVTSAKDYQERPSDIDEEMENIALKVLGEKKKAAFALEEFLPLAQSGKSEEVTDLLWSAFVEGRFEEQ